MRTVTEPIYKSKLTSSVIRDELTLLEGEIANTSSGHNHDG